MMSRMIYLVVFTVNYVNLEPKSVQIVRFLVIGEVSKEKSVEAKFVS